MSTRYCFGALATQAPPFWPRERFAEAERLTLAGETPESWLIVNLAREIFTDSIRAPTWRINRALLDEIQDDSDA